MKKVLLLSILSLVAVSYGIAQTTTTNNTLGATGVTGIQSTAASGYKLSVGGAVKLYGTGLSTSSSPSLYLRNTTASTGRNYYINSSDDGLFQVVDSNAGNAIRLVLNNLGYLGINTTSPAYHLDVNGSINTTGNIYLPAGTSSAGIVYMGGTRFMHATGSNSTFLGFSAGTLTNTGSNTGIGTYVLASLTTGTVNVGVGNQSLLSNTSGSSNTAVGNSALRTNSTGSWNTAVGTSALNNNSTGIDNNALGAAALVSNTTGEENVALGSDVMYSNTTGSRNTVVGNNSLSTNASGNDNTALGYNALQKSTASNNTAAGDSAGNVVSTGTGNSFFGKLSGASIQTGSYNSFLGYGIYNAGTGNLTGSNNTAVGANITGMGNGNYNTVIGAGVSMPSVSNNIIVADGQGNQRIRIFNNGNTLVGYNTYADSGYKLDVSGSLRNTGGVRFQGLTTNNALSNILAADASGNLAWRDASSLGAGVANPYNWSIAGNTGINPANQFIGTTDAQPLVFKTNNQQRVSILNDGTFNIGPNDTASKPVFRVFPNGDFVSNAPRSLAGNTVGPNSGIRYNAKYGIFEVGTDNNFDTTLSTACCGSQSKSAIVINSGFMNTFKGHIHGSIVGGDNIRVDTAGSVAWSPVFGESHYINGSVVKSAIFGYGMNISQQLLASALIGFGHNTQKPISSSLITGYSNIPSDTVNVSLVSGWLHNFGGVGQLLSGTQLINKTPNGTALGNQNVDFSSLSYTGNGGTALSNVANLGKYPIFVIGNSKYTYNSGIRSNAMTVLYNGRTQINTTGFINNLTEANVTPKAALEIVSNNSGILIPKLTTGQRDSIVAGDLQNGLLLYNISTNQFQFYNGTAWKSITDSSTVGQAINQSGWGLAGNSGINPATQFMGTTDAQPLLFKTNNVEALRIGSGGNVTIGAPVLPNTSYKLEVNGIIHSQKVKVDMTGWSDYVFDNDYRLRSLEEVQEFISKNKHLPDVPSADEVKKKGIDLGENQSVLLRKIEELTLYSIDQKKTIQDQSKKIDDLQQQIDELKKLIQKK